MKRKKEGSSATQEALINRAAKKWRGPPKAIAEDIAGCTGQYRAGRQVCAQAEYGQGGRGAGGGGAIPEWDAHVGEPKSSGSECRMQGDKATIHKRVEELGM